MSKSPSSSSAVKMPTNPYNDTLAKISREQWDHWQQTYKPVEERLLSEHKNFDLNAANNLANVDTHLGQSLGASRGIMGRNLDRYQALQPRGTQAVNDRLDNMTLALGSADGRNRSRLAALDRKAELLSGLNAIGMGASQMATNTYGNVAGLAQQRIDASQVTNPGMSALGGGLSGAVSGFMMTGSPYGAIAGGVLGAGSSYYANS
jgi:hypothetical protein